MNMGPQQKIPRVSVSENVSNSENSSDGMESYDSSVGEDSDTNDVTNEDAPDKVNPGWADAMARILNSTKPLKRKSVILSKAKKLTQVQVKDERDKPGFEIEGEIKEEKPDVNKLQLLKKSSRSLKRSELENKFRLKPSVLDKEREKTLQRIATKGVVTLFNVVQKEQQKIESKMKEIGYSEIKKDRFIKSYDKNEFLNILKDNTKNQPADSVIKQEKIKIKEEEGDGDEQETWDVLRNDYMMGARMKDWKDSEEMNESDSKESFGNSDEESDD